MIFPLPKLPPDLLHPHEFIVSFSLSLENRHSKRLNNNSKIKHKQTNENRTKQTKKKKKHKKYIQIRDTYIEIP